MTMSMKEIVAKFAELEARVKVIESREPKAHTFDETQKTKPSAIDPKAKK
jgi:hypothetical protein